MIIDRPFCRAKRAECPTDLSLSWPQLRSRHSSIHRYAVPTGGNLSSQDASFNVGRLRKLFGLRFGEDDPIVNLTQPQRAAD